MVHKPNLSIIHCGDDVARHWEYLSHIEVNGMRCNQPLTMDKHRGTRAQITDHVLPVGKRGSGYGQYVKEHIEPFDGFIFLGFPSAHRDRSGEEFYTSYVLYNLFHATSILVGGRITQSPEYLVSIAGKKPMPKPVYFEGNDYEHLHRLLENFKSPGVGTIPAEDMAHFSHINQRHMIDLSPLIIDGKAAKIEDTTRAGPSKRPHTVVDRNTQRPKFVVGVLCSAFTTDAAFLKAASNIGKVLIKNKWGLMSGGCSKGMMGAAHNVVKEAGGYSAAATLKDSSFGETRNTPDNLDKEWQKVIVSERIREIGSQSDAIVAMQGGFMSFQELLQFIILKRTKNEIMDGKSIIILNENGFYDNFIEIAKRFKFDKYFQVAKNIDQCEELLVKAEKAHSPRSHPRYQQGDWSWDR